LTTTCILDQNWCTIANTAMYIWTDDNCNTCKWHYHSSICRLIIKLVVIQSTIPFTKKSANHLQSHWHQHPHYQMYTYIERTIILTACQMQYWNTITSWLHNQLIMHFTSAGWPLFFNRIQVINIAWYTSVYPFRICYMAILRITGSH
jgi:hypothetical protein